MSLRSHNWFLREGPAGFGYRSRYNLRAGHIPSGVDTRGSTCWRSGRCAPCPLSVDIDEPVGTTNFRNLDLLPSLDVCEVCVKIGSDPTAFSPCTEEPLQWGSATGS